MRLRSKAWTLGERNKNLGPAPVQVRPACRVRAWLSISFLKTPRRYLNGSNPCKFPVARHSFPSTVIISLSFKVERCRNETTQTMRRRLVERSNPRYKKRNTMYTSSGPLLATETCHPILPHLSMGYIFSFFATFVLVANRTYAAARFALL
jgi:hypothetical protein